jgi:hypothetical protein
MISLSGHIFLDLCFLCFQKGALRSDMPTSTTVVTYRRSSDGKGLLSARNISIKLVLPFIFDSGGRIWDCRLNKDSPGGRGRVSGRRYIPETSLVGWALLN